MCLILGAPLLIVLKGSIDRCLHSGPHDDVVVGHRGTSPRTQEADRDPTNSWQIPLKKKSVYSNETSVVASAFLLRCAYALCTNVCDGFKHVQLPS
jgi:hypothetical protein